MSARIDAPVCDSDAEEAVVSAILCDAPVLETVRDYVREDDFYLDHYRQVFAACVAVDERTGKFDVVSVTGWLRANGRLDQIGGATRLAEILNAPAVPLANAKEHAQRVSELARQRRVTDAARVIAATGARHLDGTVDGFCHDAEARISAAIESGSTRDTPEAVGVVAAQVIEEASKRGDKAIGDPSGLKSLDRALDGFECGMYVIAGRPGMGKTALAKAIAKGLAVNTGKLTVFVSCEMPKAQLAQRMLCAEAKVPMQAFRSGQLTPSHRALLVDAAVKLNQIPMVLTHRPAATVSEVRGVVRRSLREQRRRFGEDLQLGCVVVDYMQIMAGDQRGNREGEVSSISRGLMALAGEFGVPLFALSQLNRSVETRTDKRPTMSDLRESGAIEQDAYVILFPYRDEVYNPDTADQGLAEIIIGKSRNGEPGGKVRLAFRGKYALFENRNTPDEDDYTNIFD